MDGYFHYLAKRFVDIAGGRASWSRKAAGRVEDSDRLFHSLRNVGQGHTESLDSREGILEIQRVGIAVDPTELHHLEWPFRLDKLVKLEIPFGKATHLFSSKLYLKVLGRLLSDATAKVQLVYLTVLIPHRRLIVHNELPPKRSWWLRRTTRRPAIRLYFATLQLCRKTDRLFIC